MISAVMRMFWCALSLLVIGKQGIAQSAATKASALRYEIDAKRVGVDVLSDDALPRSREFLRIDSSYYVGWMYEGIYKANHAADYLGYKNAIAPLKRALNNIERDYKKELTTRSANLVTYFPVYRYQVDYSQIAYYLYTCYSNIEEPDKVYALLQRVLQRKFQKDFYLDPYNHLGWIVHRNRFHTSARHAFLKNNIPDNERLAHAYLDSGMERISKNHSLNSTLFGSSSDVAERLSVYHYKSILYGYALQIDSTEHYYALMRGQSNFPHNNYGNFKSVIGEFREAESEYQQAAQQESGDKRLQEWAYYSSIIEIAKGKPDNGVALMKEHLRAAGSTPGFGWYNIALARAHFYNGAMSDAKLYVDKAAGFKELHIGTTLGQSHYDFAIQLQKLAQQQAIIAAQKFEHKNWWYNPSVWATLIAAQANKYVQQFLLANQLAQNPERDRVIYKLFSTESVVCWDEIWFLIKDFSSNYFLQRFEAERKDDSRPYIKKYFGLMVAKLEMQKGNYKKAWGLLQNLLQAPNTDLEYEKLYAARLLEAQAICAYELDKDAEGDEALNQLYSTYPQLLPFSTLKMKMRLSVKGSDDKNITKRLHGFRIDFDGDQTTPIAQLTYSRKGQFNSVQYQVVRADGATIIPTTTFSFKDEREAVLKLAYGLFKVGTTGEAKEKGDVK